ncbi:MAG: chain-length determining protein [Prevotellaceae bacterium]|nr:chain-length determining protein [Candidatus Colivivens equi]
MKQEDNEIIETVETVEIEERKLDIKTVISLLLQKKKQFVYGVVIAFVLSCIWILPQPRYYVTTVTLAPEHGENTTGSAIGSIASSFGFDLGNTASNDAIYPMLYPDVIQSSDFLIGLFDIKVNSIDGAIKDMRYYDYLAFNQKQSFWMVPINTVKNVIENLLSHNNYESSNDKEHKVDPFRLNKREYNVIMNLQNILECNYDLKTEVITLTLQDQDPLICATVIDSVRNRLQNYIIEYRTSKVRIDAEYYEKMTNKASLEYDLAAEEYAKYCDSHNNLILQAYVTKRDALENEMQSKFQTYSMYKTQLQAAKAKIQECTPAFTIIQGSTVPIKPAGPKRMIFVAAMMILTVLGESVYFLRKYIF